MGEAHDNNIIFLNFSKGCGTLFNVKEVGIYRSTARVHKAITNFHIASTNENSPSKLCDVVQPIIECQVIRVMCSNQSKFSKIPP